MILVSPTGRDDGRKGIDRELKRGSLELIVLHLLSLGEAYGYEIVTALTERTNGGLEVTDGTLYPVLYRLDAADSSRSNGKPRARRTRKYYRLAKAGHAELVQLSHEWKTFASAMAQLLGQQPEIGEDRGVLYRSGHGTLATGWGSEIAGRDGARSHIAERVEHGQTVDDALRQLGDPVTLAESYSQRFLWCQRRSGGGGSRGSSISSQSSACARRSCGSSGRPRLLSFHRGLSSPL